MNFLIVAIIGLIITIIAFVSPEKLVKADTPEKQKSLVILFRVCGIIMFIAGLIVSILKG